MTGEQFVKLCYEEKDNERSQKNKFQPFRIHYR